MKGRRDMNIEQRDKTENNVLKARHTHFATPFQPDPNILRARMKAGEGAKSAAHPSVLYRCDIHTLGV